MLSLAPDDLSASGGRFPAKWIGLKCSSCHFCPPSGSANFFSEIANRRVKMGLRLESGCGDQSPGMRSVHRATYSP